MRCRDVVSAVLYQLSPHQCNDRTQKSPHSFKSMHVIEPELKMAVMGLLWSLIHNLRQRRHVIRLRHGVKPLHGRYLEKGVGNNLGGD